jgi:hypothetical protein
MNISRVWSPAFMEWVRWKSDPTLMSYASVSDQPLEVAVQFDYLVRKYGRDERSAAQAIYEQHRNALLKMIYSGEG